MIVLIHRLTQASSNAVSACLYLLTVITLFLFYTSHVSEALLFSDCHSCHRTLAFLLVLLSVRCWVALPLISSWRFCFLFLGRCCVCAQNTPVIVRRAACDITVISPLISVFLGRLRLLHSFCSVWQRKRSSIFSSHVTTRYIFAYFVSKFWLCIW